MPRIMSERITFFFIVQPGNLSFRGRFLAATLRTHAPPGTRIEAFVPDSANDLDDNTLRTLAHFDVRLRSFTPELWPRFDYPIGNKVDAAAQAFDTDFAVFLDTDIVVTRAFDPAALMDSALSARPIMGAQVFVGQSGKTYNDFVKETLGVAHLPLSERSKQARALCPKRLSTRLPLFNSGVVAFDTRTAFAALWKRRTIEVMSAANLPARMRRPFGDQAALGIVAHQMRNRLGVLDHKWNASFRTPIQHVVFWHYFRVFSLLRQAEGRALFLSMHRRYKDEGLNLLGEISEKDLSDLFESGREFRQVKPSSAGR